MAKYGLETENTVHVKGMSIGEPSGGGNSVIITEKNFRLGSFPSGPMYLNVLDSDEFFVLTEDDLAESMSFLWWIIFMLDCIKESLGLDAHSLADQIEYPGLNADTLDSFIGLFKKKEKYRYSSYNDVVYFSDVKVTQPISKGLLPYFVAANLIITYNDKRPFDEIVAEVIASMESKLSFENSPSVTECCYIFPRVNKNGMINLMRTFADAYQSNPISARAASTISLLPR